MPSVTMLIGWGKRPVQEAWTALSVLACIAERERNGGRG
jgi:hypothetical protein